MKIAVLMWYNDSIKNYGDITYKLNQKYCDIHDYTLIKSSERSYIDRCANWERIPLALKHIDDYDYIAWIDADAFFYTDSPPITNLIHLHKDKNFIFSYDVKVKWKWDFRAAVNSGVFIAKNSNYTKQFLKEWGYSDEVRKKGKKLHYEDQGGLRYMLGKNSLNIGDKSAIIPFGIFQEFYKNRYFILDGCSKFEKGMKKVGMKFNSGKEYGLKNRPFIFHVANEPDAVRAEVAKHYLSTGQILPRK
tara:strand:- start:214 stop:954 length:741 start_codon:yes stop_codon:yes gene_type:complete